MSRWNVLLISLWALSIGRPPSVTSAQIIPGVQSPDAKVERLPAVDGFGAVAERGEGLSLEEVHPGVRFPEFVEKDTTRSVNAPNAFVKEPSVSASFPPPPPAPDEVSEEVLPLLEEELWLHGGSYLYHPEGDRLGWPDEHDSHHHFQLLRLPETWKEARPLTGRALFLGADPIQPSPNLKWFGAEGFQWEPRFVGYGGYQLFAMAFEDGGRRTDGVGHQMFVDLDLRLTGTERAHVQFRPFGERNTGGSLYQFSNPDGYRDNSTIAPDRWWIEGELFSIFGGIFSDQFAARDYHFVIGKFPFALQNSLLINDEITGIVVNKNTIMVGPVSNVNVQVFSAIDDVDAFPGASADLFGTNVSADYRGAFYEGTYAYVAHGNDGSRDANYAAISGTKFFGPLSIAARGLFKWGDAGGRGDGQLYVLESNYTRYFSEGMHNFTGIKYGVFYANAFRATSGWNSISGGNVDRLRATFEVNPLVRLALARPPDNTYGAALGVQLFRRHEDESIIPEIAIESPNEEFTGGVGLRYLRKLSPRTFFDAQALRTWSDDSRLEREGVFLSTTVLF